MFIFNTILEDFDETKDKVHQHFKKNWKKYAAGAAGAVALGGAAYGANKLYNDHRINKMKETGDMRSSDAKTRSKEDSEEAQDKGWKKAHEELVQADKNPIGWGVKKLARDFPNNVEYMKWKAGQLKDKVMGED